MQPSAKKGILLAIGAAALYAINAPLSKLLLEEIIMFPKHSVVMLFPLAVN